MNVEIGSLNHGGKQDLDNGETDGGMLGGRPLIK